MRPLRGRAVLALELERGNDRRQHHCTLLPKATDPSAPCVAARWRVHRRSYLLQGCFEEDDGSVSGPGAVVVHAAGSEHAFTALPGPDLVYLAVIRDGVAFGENVMRPGSPDA